MSEQIFCKICNKNSEYNILSHFIRYHLNKIHDMTPEQYYIEYFKKEIRDGLCNNLNCFNKTKFISLNLGFRKYCSNKCTQNDPNFLKEREENNFKKTGYKHPRSNPEFKKKIEEKNLKKFGFKSFFETEDFKNKRKQSLIKKFGTEEYFNSEEFKQFYENHKDEIYLKSKISMILKYGVDNIMKSDFGLAQRNKNNLEKYGVKNVFELEQIKDLIRKTKLEKYGHENHNSSEIQKQKKRDYYKNLSSEQKEKLKSKIIQAKYKGFLEIIKPIFDLNYELINYDVKDRHELKCPLNHNFKIQGQLLIDRIRENVVICTECNHLIKPFSLAEKELLNFIKDNTELEVQENVYGLIDERLELDIYIPELKLGFEYNGLFWHNEINKGVTYHFNKTNLFESEGMRIIHVYEDDWNTKKEIVKSRILNILGKTKEIIYARKCKIKEVSYNDTKMFLNKNHIQGNSISKYRVGLYYNDELVSLMSFVRPRNGMGYKTTNNNNTLELIRFCNKLNTNVVGGASKLFQYFIKNHEVEKIISYADRSWSQGNLYETLKFQFVRKTRPNYWYIVNGIKESRFKYFKLKLVEQGFDTNKTEHKIMLEREIYRIYDSGSLLFEYINPKQ